MQLTDLRTPAATAVVVALLVVGVTAGAGVVADYTDSQASPQSPPAAYDVNSLLPQPVPDDGTVPAANAGESKTVVVDVSHGNAISRTKLQPLVNSLTAAGHEVRFFSGGSATSYMSDESSAFAKTLRDADALVVANPATSYTAQEVDTVESFTDAGGRLLLLADTPSEATSTSSLLGLTSASSGVGSGQPDNVAARFGATFDAGYLYDMTENANNFQYVYAAARGSGVAASADRTVLHAPVPVVASASATTALSVTNASYSTTRRNGTYTVAVQRENVLAIGDTWFLSPDGATVADNERLVGGVAEFLVSGSKTPGAPRSGAAASNGSSLLSGNTTTAGATAALRR